jgi:hypothetical protein
MSAVSAVSAAEDDRATVAAVEPSAQLLAVAICRSAVTSSCDSGGRGSAFLAPAGGLLDALPERFVGSDVSASW